MLKVFIIYGKMTLAVLSSIVKKRYVTIIR